MFPGSPIFTWVLPVPCAQTSDGQRVVPLRVGYALLRLYARRVFVSLAIAASFAGTLGATAPLRVVPPPRATHSALAPADEYFGSLKLSFLGINNVLRDGAIRAGSSTTDARLIGGVDAAAEALQDWAHKYPRDPQLSRSYFLAFAMYRKVWTRDGQQRAWRFLNVIVQRWPSLTYFGKLARSELSARIHRGTIMPTPEAVSDCDGASTCRPRRQARPRVPNRRRAPRRLRVRGAASLAA